MKNRDYRFDTLKGFLIVLIVFAHAINNKIFFVGTSSPVVYFIHFIVYIFHMPAMVFISGYFSKKNEFTGVEFRKLVSSILIPFLLMNFLIWIVDSRDLSKFFVPRYTMWFLLSLFFWRLFVHALSKFRFSLLLFTLFSLYIGLTTANDFFSISRTIAFFPFFLAGYYFEKEHVDRIRSINKLIVVGTLIIAFIIAVIMEQNGVPDSMLLMKTPYAEYEMKTIVCLLLRAAILLIAFVITMCLVALVPAQKNILSTLGSRTMTVYLAHGIVIKTLKRIFNNVKFANEIQLIPISIVITLVICIVFGSSFVDKLYKETLQRISAICLKPIDSSIEIGERQ